MRWGGFECIGMCCLSFEICSNSVSGKTDSPTHCIHQMFSFIYVYILLCYISIFGHHQFTTSHTHHSYVGKKMLHFVFSQSIKCHMSQHGLKFWHMSTFEDFSVSCQSMHGIYQNHIQVTHAGNHREESPFSLVKDIQREAMCQEKTN